MIIQTKWKGKDGEERVLAMEFSDLTGNFKSVAFKGRAKDFKKEQYTNMLNMTTCMRCGKSFKDINYNKLTEKGIGNIAKRIFCNACIDILWKDKKEKEKV